MGPFAVLSRPHPLSPAVPKNPTQKSLAPWMGAKRKLAQRIAALLGPRRSYFEPFFGSGAVFFASSPALFECVNDMNRDLVNVTKVLQTPDKGRDLIGRLMYTIYSQELYREARTRICDPFTGELGDVERALAALIVWWMGRKGVAGTSPSQTGFSARFTSKGGGGGVAWRSFVSSVPWFMKRLARVEVLNRCGIGLTEAIADEPDCCVYLDPPYFVKAKPYLHDFTPDDHIRLAKAAARFRRARVVVSYYPHPLVDAYYGDGWQRVEVVTTKNIRNQASRATGATKATELLLCNFEVRRADLFG